MRLPPDPRGHGLTDRSGFKRQFKLMFKPVRVAATIIMLVAIVLSFVAAFALPSNLAVLCVRVARCGLRR